MTVTRREPREFWLYESVTDAKDKDGCLTACLVGETDNKEYKGFIRAREVLTPDPRDQALKLAAEAMNTHRNNWHEDMFCTPECKFICAALTAMDKIMEEK